MLDTPIIYDDSLVYYQYLSSCVIREDMDTHSSHNLMWIGPALPRPDNEFDQIIKIGTISLRYESKLD